MALHVYNTTANADSVYYVQTDLLGSWDRIVDGSRTVVQSSHFDPWGNRMSASDWSLTQDGSNLPFHRGFTGHEHYDRFGIINMNARLYDPVIARFFSPDPQVQNPTSTQGFNRYSYCNNNPVMNTDPDGEFYIIDAWKLGFIHGFFMSSEHRWRNAWNTANRLAGNDIKIMGGLFVTDRNKSFCARVMEFKTRFNWQLPQMTAGFVMAQVANMSELIFDNGGIQSIGYAYGATAVTYNAREWGAITMGNYINGENGLFANASNGLFQHEYGHYIQSQEIGLAYFSRVGIPSLSKRDQWHHPVEMDANMRAFQYFNENVSGFYSTKEEWDNRENAKYDGWDFEYNPLNNVDQYVDYHNSNHSFLHAKWYDYLWLLKGPAGTFLDGVFLKLYYNNQY